MCDTLSGVTGFVCAIHWTNTILECSNLSTQRSDWVVCAIHWTNTILECSNLFSSVPTRVCYLGSFVLSESVSFLRSRGFAPAIFFMQAAASHTGESH